MRVLPDCMRFEWFGGVHWQCLLSLLFRMTFLRVEGYRSRTLGRNSLFFCLFGVVKRELHKSSFFKLTMYFKHFLKVKTQWIALRLRNLRTVRIPAVFVAFSYPLGKVWIKLSPLKLMGKCRIDWLLKPWLETGQREGKLWMQNQLGEGWFSSGYLAQKQHSYGVWGTCNTPITLMGYVCVCKVKIRGGKKMISSIWIRWKVGECLCCVKSSRLDSHIDTGFAVSEMSRRYFCPSLVSFVFIS